MASSATGVKRAREPQQVLAKPLHHMALKRMRRAGGDIHAVLKSDVDGFARYVARRQALERLAVPEAVLAGLFRGLGGDAAALLKIVDLNLFQSNVLQVVREYAERGISMTTLNVRGHSFCMADKRAVLANFAAFYGDQRWPCDVATYVANEVFAAEERISISVLSGGGVRDVLIAEWCRMYAVTPGPNPPQLIIVNSEAGRVFLIPFMP